MSERQSRTVWFNVYPKGQSIWPSREKALENAKSNCVAVAVEATISFVEGQGRDLAAARV